MGRIDCHVHLYPPDVNSAPAPWAAAHGETHWALLCARTRKSGRPVQGFPTVDELLRAMDGAGVERVILQGWYWEKHDTCVLQNRFYADCLRLHPDRISAAAVFHPGAGAAAITEEIAWAKDHGFCGLGELSPHSQLFSVSDPVWNSALRQAGELNLPVMLHVTEPEGRGYPGRVPTPLDDFVRMAKEYPATTFVLAHWGARIISDPALGSEVAKFRNVFYDTAASPLLYGAEIFREVLNITGPDRVLFGSDYPLVLFPSREADPSIASFVQFTRVAGLSSGEETALFEQNARTVYRLLA